MMQKTSLRLPHGVGSFPKPFASVHNLNTLSISVKLIIQTVLRQPINLNDPVKKEQGCHLWPGNYNLGKMIAVSISSLFFVN